MWYALIKAGLSGLIVATVSETGKRSPSFGALIASLPLVSILGMIWLWRDTKDPVRLAAHAEATFWYVLPSLPMFLVLPKLLRSGVQFYPALVVSCVLTIVLYGLMIWTLKRFGISL